MHGILNRYHRCLATASPARGFEGRRDLRGSGRESSAERLGRRDAVGSGAHRAAEMSSFGAGRQDGMFGGGSLGLGGGMSNPILLLTAPLAGGWEQQHDSAIAQRDVVDRRPDGFSDLAIRPE